MPLLRGRLDDIQRRRSRRPRRPLLSASTGTMTSIADDYLEGVDAIVAFLGPMWTRRKVRYARTSGALPIRKKSGIGVYAFKSELTSALKSPDTLPNKNIGAKFVST